MAGALNSNPAPVTRPLPARPAADAFLKVFTLIDPKKADSVRDGDGGGGGPQICRYG